MNQADDSVEATTAAPAPEGVVESDFGQWILVDANRWLLAVVVNTRAEGFSVCSVGLSAIAPRPNH